VYEIQRIHDLHADAIAVKLRIRATPFSQLTANPNRNDRILTINCQATPLPWAHRGNFMKGYILLSEARSGSSWLCSIANATGEMGKATEALGRKFLGASPNRFSPEEFFGFAVERSSTANGRFGMKIFPKHLKWAQSQFGFDFIAKCQAEHDVKVVLFRRSDRIAQAISLHRARITSQWTSNKPQVREPKYNFEEICSAYFQIAESETFWRSYCELRQLEVETFFYEDLRADPSPYLTALAAHLDVSRPAEISSELRVQRDKTTDQWRWQFEEDARSRSVFVAGREQPTAPRTMKNFVRFLSKEALEI
jgi:LPS sulfotransferase NodH